MANDAAPVPEEKQIASLQLGEIHPAGYHLAYLGLFGAGAGQVDLADSINELSEPGAIRGRSSLQRRTPDVAGVPNLGYDHLDKTLGFNHIL
jgi:hypothetical protein